MIAIAFEIPGTFIPGRCAPRQSNRNQSLQREQPGKFFDKSYAVPPEMTRGKQRMTVRFRGRPDNFAGGIFGVKTLKQQP